MRFTRRPRCEYAVTERKRAAAARWQQRQRDSLPLLAPLIAVAQPSVEQVMAERVAHWDSTEQDCRDRRAGQWRRARRLLDEHAPAVRQALLAYWNGHRWLPGDPDYLLDMLHGFATGRLVLAEGTVRPAVTEIPASQALAAFGRGKPPARGWLGTAPASAAGRR